MNIRPVEMRTVAERFGGGIGRFRLVDLGYRCMAEYAARAIVAGIIQADSEPPGAGPQR